MYDNHIWPCVVILLCIVQQQLFHGCASTTSAKRTRRTSKRADVTTSGPYSALPQVNYHRFEWSRISGGYGGWVPFEAHLARNSAPSDFLYLFTGDTQHWFPCTADNAACHRATDHCYFRPAQRGRECNRRQSEHANKMQQISMAALNRRIFNATGRRMIAGLVINGDMTDFGHSDELERAKQLWVSSAGSFDGTIKVYPGLGNHDYANNVGQCTFDRCANRMLRWFKSYVKDMLHLPLDLRTASKYLVGEENIGSLAYSWDECSQRDQQQMSASACVHFIQLNNYPTYAKHIVSQLLLEWKILPSLNWLRNDIRRAADHQYKSIIINFHDGDTAFSLTDKLRFHSTLESSLHGSNTRILAIFFAHIHHMVGLKQWWCIQGRRVPLIYSGSVPGNNYILAHFAPTSGAMKGIYSVRVENDNESYVEIEAIPMEQEPCILG